MPDGRGPDQRRVELENGVRIEVETEYDEADKGMALDDLEYGPRRSPDWSRTVLTA